MCRGAVLLLRDSLTARRLEGDDANRPEVPARNWGSSGQIVEAPHETSRPGTQLYECLAYVLSIIARPTFLTFYSAAQILFQKVAVCRVNRRITDMEINGF